MSRYSVIVQAAFGALLLGCAMRALDGDHTAFAAVLVACAIVFLGAGAMNAERGE